MSVTLLSSPADLPHEPSPGLFVLVKDEPADGAATLAEVLGSGPPCTLAEAAGRLSAIEAETTAREAVVAAAHDPQPPIDAMAEERTRALEQMAAREEALEQAREEAAEALARVPTRARGVAAERLRSAAASIVVAEEAIVQARTVLGERPVLPPDAAQAALAAEEAVTRAHQQRVGGIDRSCALLLAANAVGLLIVAGRVWTPAIEPIFVLVAALPLTALFHLVATFASNTWQARTAVQLRTVALRETGMATMTGLTARNARVKAWTARADALAAAEASLVQAHRRWAALTGTSAGSAQVAALLRTVADAERAGARLADLEGQATEAVPGLEPDREAVPGEEPHGEPVPGLEPDPDAVPHGQPDREVVPGLVPGRDSAPPLIVLLDGPAEGPLDDETRVLLEGWDERGIPCPLVVVTACSEVGAWADSRTVGVGGAQVVDLRERVVASLDRLRARAATFGDSRPPSPMAADG